MSPMIARLNSRAMVAVSGDDRAAFLQGLLTQDVENLAPGELRYGLLLTPQGKLLWDLFFFDDGERILLDAEAARRDSLVQRLSIYRLRAKVEIAAVEGVVFAAWGGATEGLADPRLPALGRRLYGEAAATTDEPGYDLHRLALGVPDPVRDAPPETTYPLEIDLDLLNAIDFRKGCFVGQEITSRMKRRGQIKTRTLPVTFDGEPPAFGAEVMNGDLRAGEMLSGAQGRSLALLRLDRIEGELTVDGRPLRVDRPDWFQA